MNYCIFNIHEIWLCLSVYHGQIKATLPTKYVNEDPKLQKAEKKFFEMRKKNCLH